MVGRDVGRVAVLVVIAGPSAFAEPNAVSAVEAPNGADSDDNGIAAWSAPTWVGVPWVWSERDTTVLTPSTRPRPNETDAVEEP